MTTNAMSEAVQSSGAILERVVIILEDFENFHAGALQNFITICRLETRKKYICSKYGINSAGTTNFRFIIFQQLLV